MTLLCTRVYFYMIYIQVHIVLYKFYAVFGNL